MLFFRKPCLGGFGLGFELPLVFQGRSWDKLAELGPDYEFAQQADWVTNGSPVSESGNFVKDLLAIREGAILQNLHCRGVRSSAKNGWPFEIIRNYYYADR